MSLPSQPPLAGDSCVTKAEKVERQANESKVPEGGGGAVKRKAETLDGGANSVEVPPGKRGVAPIKPEYLVRSEQRGADQFPALNRDGNSVDSIDPRDSRSAGGKRPKNKGQNTNRHFGNSNDAIQLCPSRATSSELSPASCDYGSNCKFEHDLRRYLREGKRSDLETFNGKCPVFEACGKCDAGWRCRFAASHSLEKQHEDGRRELVLFEKEKISKDTEQESDEGKSGIVNVVSGETKANLRKRKIKTPRADAYAEWLNKSISQPQGKSEGQEEQANGNSQNGEDAAEEDKKGVKNRIANYVEPPFLPSEKKRIYYGPETPVLAPLTTQGNLPFRRLCCELGAQVTWSEMAMANPLMQGEKNEWALMKAHQTELEPPKYDPVSPIPDGYDNSQDIKFGAQIATNKPAAALKTTEILTTLCPRLRAIDLNCGCPIDLVYRQGAGSALLDTPGRLEKILRGMNAVSGPVPITAKIRTGTKDNHPTAAKLVRRLAFGGPEASALDLGPAGVAAVTLHGRSRQQRYTKSADWSYIAECAAVVRSYNAARDALTDTARAPDERHLPASAGGGRMYFVGNGDCHSYTDYEAHIRSARVNTVMLARGALIKPWLFEEIASGQHLDKPARERLGYVERFARHGLEAWGSDERGVGLTRRFLLEWLSFACRYVPLGLLEVLPPRLQDRPPAYRGRDELETLLASENYRDWIRISEMFLGKAPEGFRFEPKHRSNSWEAAEG